MPLSRFDPLEVRVRSTWWRDESELDQQQLEVIRLDIDERAVLVTGQPGSGKTNLALLRANYLVLSSFPNVKVLTVGRVISNFILSGARLHGLDEDQVQTFHRWAQSVVRDAGETPPQMGADYEASLAALVEQLRDLKNQGRFNPIDAIIVDEAQDFPSGCAEIFRAMTDRLFVTGDERQRIFDHTAKTLSEFRESARIIDLKHHYRNGRKICHLAGSLKGIDYSATSRYDEIANPSVFVRYRCATLREQVETACRAIPNQLAAYPDDLVGIIVPTNDALQDVRDILDGSDLTDQVQVQSSRDGYHELDPAKRIIVLTMASAKGLEFRSAHFVAADEITDWPESGKLRNLVFTTITRAKTSLAIYHIDPLKKWLESAILKVTSTPQAPPTRSIFPQATAQ